MIYMIIFINKMKKAPLIQHLCENITALEERNAKLAEQVSEYDKEKRIIL